MSNSSENVNLRYSSLLSAVLTAEAFYKNYEQLKKKLIDTVGQIQDGNIMPVAATNGFFALELYLKVIYAYDQYQKKNEKAEDLTTYLRGHNLKKLYEALDTDLKEKITKQFSCSITTEEIIKELDKYENAFGQWRYFYEHESLAGNFAFLSKILKALYSYCNSIEFNINEEWLKNGPKTEVIMFQEPIYSKADLEEAMNLSLKEKARYNRCNPCS